MNDVQRQVMGALVTKPLSTEDLVVALAPTTEGEVKSALYQLTQTYHVIKHPVIGDGCRNCACQVSYAWRLTLKGRQAISQEAT